MSICDFLVQIIWFLTAILCLLAVQRLVSMDFEVEATIMLITSGIGIAFNLV